MLRSLRFRLLCERHRDDIFRFALSMLRNRADAEDATQEVLLKLWRNMDRIRQGASRSWAMSVTRNHCLDAMRRRQHPVADAEPLWPASEPNLVDSASHGPEGAADGALLQERVEELMGQMPEKLRSVFVLHEVNGLRYREIAAALDLPINSVKAYLFRARRHLREQLTEYRRELTEAS